ncbi:MAG: 23S rRNA (pseudouridine(1915)-N(3))-methyltransferase RlmH [Oscillospiraceae bacterium]
MQRITLICVGTLKEQYLRDAFSEYSKRLSGYCNLSILEISEYKLPQNPSEKQILSGLEKEGEKIIAQIPGTAIVIPLCIEGKMLSSADLSSRISQLLVMGASNICFIIGGSYGLSDAVKSLGNFKLSMSRMTFPHQLARIMLAEQIYRCFKISNHESYHK